MYQIDVFGAELYYVLWFFYLFSFLGVVVEMLFCYAREGVIESRLGLLYLPLSPIYGAGGVVLTLYLRRFLDEPVLLFLAGIVVGTVLEYVVSLVMEKVFHTVFWDYSDKPLNLHGRVCLQYSFYWGLLSLFLLYVISRYTFALVQSIPRGIGDGVLTALNVLTAVSVVLTLATFARLRQRVDVLRLSSSRRPAIEGADGTPDRAGDAAGDGRPVRLLDRLVPDPVLINTFPRMSLVVEYMQLTGQERKWLRVDLHLGRPSALRRRLAHDVPALTGHDD